jgi:ABC-type glycerol-3-phosphate transport system substrate-binding protein
MFVERSGQAPWRLAVTAVALMLLIAACAGPAASPPASGGQSAGAGEAVVIEWYVGLGTGENEEQIPIEEDVVAAFNASHTDVQIKFTVVGNTVAYDTLAARLPSDPPDLIGPIGIRALQSYGDQLLDLSTYIFRRPRSWRWHCQ